MTASGGGPPPFTRRANPEFHLAGDCAAKVDRLEAEVAMLRRRLADKVVGELVFDPPAELRGCKVPGSGGEQHALKNGHTIAVLHSPEHASEDDIQTYVNACVELVRDDSVDAAIHVPHGWRLGVGRVREKKP